MCRVCVRLYFSPLTNPRRLEQDHDSPHAGPLDDLADAGARNSESPGYVCVISAPKEILEQIGVFFAVFRHAKPWPPNGFRLPFLLHLIITLAPALLLSLCR